MAGDRIPPPALGGGKEMTRQEAAEYSASLLEALRSIAQGAKLSFLAYLIGMALEEAEAEKARRD